MKLRVDVFGEEVMDVIKLGAVIASLLSDPVNLRYARYEDLPRRPSVKQRNWEGETPFSA